MTKKTVFLKKYIRKFKSKFKHISHTVNDSYFWKIILEYKFYVLLIVLGLIFLVVLSEKIWALVFLAIISYVTAIIDDAMSLYYPIQTGPAFCLFLAALKINFWLLTVFFIVAIILPHLQLQRIFEPFNLMIYLGLVIILKIIRMLPFDSFLATIFGLIIFHFWVFIIQYFKGSSRKTIWAVFKNFVLIIILFLSPLNSILSI